MKKGPGYREFVTLMAVIISITALSIDMMLPALPDIGQELGARHPNHAQLVVSLVLFGFGAGQILLGPLSDCFGRKPIILMGFLVFLLGCLISIFSTGFHMMLAGRFVQGMGMAGPRTAIIALIRDLYSGRPMARIVSVIMAVFIFIPAIAPALGQTILLVAGWRSIFGFLMFQGAITLTWFCFRQPETLPKEKRLPFSLTRIFKGGMDVVRNRIALGYTLASGFMLGAFVGYLNCAQQIFQDTYDLGREFPIYMAFLALSVGSASFVNSRIVMRLGMRALSWWSVVAFIGVTSIYLFISLTLHGHPPLWLTMVGFSVSFFCLGIVFGNQNAIAMEPLAHIAGVGSAVIGSLATLLSSLFGMILGQFFNGTTIPLAVGFVILGVFTTGTMYWANRPSKRSAQ